MNITTIAAALVAATMGVTPVVNDLVCAPIASADSAAIHNLGDQADLVDGSVVQRWTLSDLQRSTDSIPYPVQGTLWEATATDEALQGSALPIVSDLNARAPSGQTYRTLFQVATPDGVNPAPLAQGQKTSGKVYFDVTGDAPDSLLYATGGDDLLVWVKPQASAPQPQTEALRSRQVALPASADMPPASAPAAPAGELPATGWQGTPLPPAGWQGTPLPPAGSQGTPLPPAAAGAAPAPAQPTPLAAAPAANQGTPQSAGWQGTPQPPTAADVPQTTTAAAAPTP